MTQPIPLWELALAQRSRTERQRRIRARHAKTRRIEALRSLEDALYRAGFVPGRSIDTWSRARQGQAYLWARAFLAGDENLPPPEFLVRWRLRWALKWYA
jgi:hypothetical protein